MVSVMTSINLNLIVSKSVGDRVSVTVKGQVRDKFVTPIAVRLNMLQTVQASTFSDCQAPIVNYIVGVEWSRHR